MSRGESKLHNIILFDGECNFCETSVNFIIKRDKKAIFRFSSVQSDIAKEIIRKHNAYWDLDSLILVEQNKCYYKSSAVLRICKRLEGPWKLFYFFIVLPIPLRDYFYDLVAKNRYKWFGKKTDCILPSPDIRNRFL
jgi:predicted DCC family thiol-disulfide oxidoreductase YuxK